MSVRGLSALNQIGIGKHVAEEYGIPMYSRLIHTPSGETYAVPYGKKDECIYSVGRRYINEVLLSEGEKFPNLHYHFEHKLTDIDVEKADISFQCPGNEDPIKVTENDFVLGCDGAFSNIRKALMRKPYFNYSQEYIPHAYLELSIDAVIREDGTKDFGIPPNHLHIWPRGQFMMIALPNQDRSFTLTLFMPTETFNGIKDMYDLMAFFEKYFPDSIEPIGKDKLIKDYFATKPVSLISIKCSPYNWLDKCLIMGDAAHAMVPFYGQGMNCGMEDTLVLYHFMSVKYPDDRLLAFTEYSKHRNPDAEAMCDLAMYNYIEMRDLVNKTSFLLRKKLDNFLFWIMPQRWVPLYTSVTFSRMRYSHCISNKKWQDDLLDTLIQRIGIAAGIVFVIGGSYLFQQRNESSIFNISSIHLHLIERIHSLFT